MVYKNLKGFEEKKINDKKIRTKMQNMVECIVKGKEM